MASHVSWTVRRPVQRGFGDIGIVPFWHGNVWASTSADEHCNGLGNVRPIRRPIGGVMEHRPGIPRHRCVGKGWLVEQQILYPSDVSSHDGRNQRLAIGIASVDHVAESTPQCLDVSEGEHGVGDLGEAGDVGSSDIVDAVVAECRGSTHWSWISCMIDAESGVDLRRATTRSAASSGSVRDPRRQPRRHWLPCLGRTTRWRPASAWMASIWVGMLAPSASAIETIADESASVVDVELVLGGARKGEVAWNRPWCGVGVVVAAELIGIFADATPAVLLEILEPLEPFTGDAVGIVDEPARVRGGDGDGAELCELLDGVQGDVAGTRDDGPFALDAVAGVGEHVVHEVDGAVAGCLGSDQAAAERQPLAGDGAGEAVLEPLVLAEEVADLPGADTDVAGRDVDVVADMAMEFDHQRLAETHHFAIRLALGVEVRAALCPSHRQRGQAVLEGLLEAEELQDRQRDDRGGTGDRPCRGRSSC